MTPIAFSAALTSLSTRQYGWLVTGAAGFIGSHLVESLLKWGQQVVGLDNFATGRASNLESVRAAVTVTAGEEAWKRFRFVEGDVTSAQACQEALHALGQPVDFVLHHAALGSVPRSMMDPMSTQRANVDGTLQMLLAARDAGVQRFVYASSSSVYGDDPSQPKRVGSEGRPLSPYALSKAMNEQYADLFARTWGLTAIGLRYFNVFGPRQDPNGPYAAVIPRWVASLLAGTPCMIHGDGTTSRDFCYVANVVQANVLASLSDLSAGSHTVCNIANGQSTSLTELYTLIRNRLHELDPSLPIAELQPQYGPFRAGDIKHSLADLQESTQVLGYAPTHTIADGLRETLAHELATLHN